MAVWRGRRRLPMTRIAMTDGREMLMFDTPLDFIIWMEAHPDLKDEVKYGLWQWSEDDMIEGDAREAAPAQ